MTFHRCDICGKEIQNKYVVRETDPADYYYGEFTIETSIEMQGHYQFGFEDICWGCAKKIKNIDSDDFKEFFIEKFMNYQN